MSQTRTEFENAFRAAREGFDFCRQEFEPSEDMTAVQRNRLEQKWFSALAMAQGWNARCALEARHFARSRDPLLAFARLLKSAKSPNQWIRNEARQTLKRSAACRAAKRKPQE